MGPWALALCAWPGILASMSRAMLSALARRLRAERGQTSVEYVGVFLVACAIVAVLLNAGIGELLAAKLKAQIVAVSTDQESGGGGSSKGGDSSGGSGDSSDGGSGGAGGGSGSGDEGGGPGQAPGAGGGGPPGAGTEDSRVPGGAAGRGGEAGPKPPSAGDRSGHTEPPDQTSDVAAKCVSGVDAARECADKALDLPAYFAKQRSAAALDRLRRAQRKILTSGARTGSPEFERLVAKRDKARAYYLETKRTARRLPVKVAGWAKKLVGTTPGDLTDVTRAARDRVRAPEKAAPKPATRPTTTSYRGPKTKSAAQKVLGGVKQHGGKLVRGLGIAGTVTGAYTNSKRDGIPKGLTETAGQAAGAYGFGTVAAAGCAALAVTGAGAVLCGAGVLVVSFAGSEVGKRLGAAAYDNVLAPVGRGLRDAGKAYYDNVTKPAVETVAKGAAKVKDGVGKAAAAINPFD
jgi:hypothetical protein